MTRGADGRIGVGGGKDRLAASPEMAALLLRLLDLRAGRAYISAITNSARHG